MEIESREKEKRTLSYYEENASAFCEGTRNADMSEMCRQASAYLGQEVQCRRFEEIDEKEVYDGIWACASLLHVPYELLS